MKRLLAVALCLGLAATVNAAMSDNFNDNDISDWTVINQEAGHPFQLFDQGSGDYCMYKDDAEASSGNMTSWGLLEKSVNGPYSTGTVVLDANISFDYTSGSRHVGFALVDASGNGIWYLFFPIPAQQTELDVDLGYASNNALSVTKETESSGIWTGDTTVDRHVAMTVEMSTGNCSIVVEGSIVKTWTADLSGQGIGPIASVVIGEHKHGYIDDIIVTPDPATLALLALGGLALVRRKR
jgi:hypothetical protein